MSIAIALLLFTPSHLSTNLLAIFQQDKNIEKLKVVNSFERASTLFVSTKGFSKESRDVLLELEKKLQSFDFVESTTFNIGKIKISDYVKKNYYLLSDFQEISLTHKEIHKRMLALKNTLLEATFYTPIDKNDPFKLFRFTRQQSDKMSKDSYLTLGEEGYLLTAELTAKTNEMKKAKEIESTLQTLLLNYPEVTAFSTLFFTAQNSSIIEENVHTILYLSFALLIVLFFITLRDYKLLLLNSITLGSSILFSLALLTYIFEEVSIFVLAFGSAISSISVDYLFHNYFHGQYQKREISKTIMWAFLTTILGFFMLQFVAFPLISQLSLFALLSLSFSYFQFTFLYPYFNLQPKEKRLKLAFASNLKKVLPVKSVFLFSLLAIGYAGWNVEFDYNLQNLDYDNKPLKAKQAQIQNAMKEKATLLIEAESLETLIHKTSLLKEKVPSLQSFSDFALTQEVFRKKRERLEQFDFVSLKSILSEEAVLLGFKANYFESAYDFVAHIPSVYLAQKEVFKELGFEVIERNEKFYTLANIKRSSLPLVPTVVGVSSIETAKLIELSMSTMFESLLFYLLLSFVCVFLIILFIARKKIILALNFIFFPVAMIILYLSFFQINIMHLFSIIIIIVAGIDYGIYMSQENSVKTDEAIFYSLFTSFSGFGILIFSSIGAIHSIGEVITIGIVSILFLVLLIKNN
jgi:predicted exporter